MTIPVDREKNLRAEAAARREKIEEQRVQRARQAQIAQAKALAKKGGLFILGAIVVFVVTVFLVQFAWNVGVVGAIVACGGSASSISYGTAFGVTLALMCVRSTYVKKN